MAEREAAKKVFNGRVIKALPPPLELDGRRNFFLFKLPKSSLFLNGRPLTPPPSYGTAI